MKVRYFLLAAALAGIAATFLPWDQFDNKSIDGRESQGWISLAAFVAAAACTFAKPRWAIRGILIVAAAVAVSAAMIRMREQGMFALAYASSPDYEMRKLSVQLRPGHGLHLVIGASLALVLGALMWRPGSMSKKPADLPRAKLVS